MGTGYAIWTGTGAALTVAYAMLTGTEDSSLLKIMFLSSIIASVVGLKIVGTKKRVTLTAADSQGSGQRSVPER